MRHKILFISSWFPSRIEPANGNFVQMHAEAAATLNDVEILHAVGDPEQKVPFQMDDKTVNGIRTLVMYYPQTKNPAINFYRRMNAYKKGFSYLQKPDLVHANVLHTHLFFAVWLKRKFGIPFVATEHFTDYRPINFEKLSFQKKKMAKIIGNAASALLPVTRDLAFGLAKLGITTPMRVIPNVVDTNNFSPKNSPSGKFTFLHISNLEPRKNTEKIINSAIELLAEGLDFNVKIGGDGTPEDLQKLEKIAERSGFSDRIEVFGRLNSTEVAAKMRDADCFILFSDDENQPCVIAESFASGIKVISSDVGGIAEFFPENFGILTDLNPSNLQKAMKEILQ